LNKNARFFCENALFLLNLIIINDLYRNGLYFMSNGRSRPIRDHRIGSIHSKICGIIKSQSLREFSTTSGVSMGTLTNILNKSGLPGLENLFKIADAAEISLEQLLCSKDGSDSAKD
jgi:lambda repressor-like predicted transcriptional regulator